ncbi:MAG: putative oxidoreductase iron-sulfur subunit, associated with bss3 [Firmicutes bacterium]|nr:putative oxidoreductase iron-sulfur subunit, associated with bss3 [Bacillota bacterium]
MARKGLLIDYEYCTGCQTCEVACKQENNYPAQRWGIKLNEIILQSINKVEIHYLPFPTELCNLCVARTDRGEQPACVKHCQAGCMKYGELTELVKEMEHKPQTVLFAPK